MAVVEVDPTFYVTCRLCLDSKGKYVIVPTIQMQIQYCYDIEINPFDGLPQLICQNCQDTLLKYYEIKNMYIDKQQALKDKLLNNKEFSTGIQSTERESLLPPKSKDLENQDRRRRKKIKSKRDHRWKTNYIKKYKCRLCHKSFQKKSILDEHILTHDRLLQKFSSIFKSYCIVKLNRIDNLPNMCNDEDAVVCNRDQIICNERQPYYHTVYLSKAKENYESSDSSENEYLTRTHRKRRRISSRSSNDTMILEDDANTNSNVPENDAHKETLNETECINLDSSDGESCGGSRMDNASNSEIANTDLKMVQTIIAKSHSKYMKKYESNDNHNMDHKQLKHKILSIGRKVINKQGFTSTGLLRFLEHKNLEIKWTPTSSFAISNSNKEANYVRLMALQGIEKSNDNLAWKYLPVCNNQIELLQELSYALHANVSKHNKSGPSHNNTTTVAYSKDLVDSVNDTTLFHSNSKLLNANPVAFPKQLPKKINAKQAEEINTHNMEDNGSLFKDVVENVYEENICMPIITSTTSLAPGVTTKEKANENINKTSNSMSPKPTTFLPIQLITNNDLIHSVITNSIAKESISETENSVNGTLKDNAQTSGTTVNTVEKPTPRIKVKPVSELMKQSALTSLSLEQTQSNIMWVPNAFSNQNVTNPGITQVTNSVQDAISAPVRYENNSMSNTSTPSAKQYVIMDTVEMPNTKTDSPIKYFRNLLQMHDLDLVEPNKALTRDYKLLIRFKLLFRQETVDQNLTLCLSLHCSGNTFCLGVKNNQERVDVDKLTANWQWEVLKVFTGDVVDKLLQNAQNVSQIMFDNTKNFTSLLKSIHFMP